MKATGPLRVLVAGGGTAGHVEPALAVADAVVAAHPGSTVVVLGTETGLETRLVPARGYQLAFVPKVPMPRRVSADLLRFPGRLKGAVVAAGAAIDALDAQVVFGVGGYASAPAYLAARRRQVPIVIHEANARAGWANRLGARLTRYVAVTHPATSLPHAVVTGLPVRRSILDLDRAATHDSAARSFGLDPAMPILLVSGGSSGAKRLNQAIVDAAVDLTVAAQVLHVTGLAAADGIRADLDARLVGEARRHYAVVDYVDGMEAAYAAADLALCRGGANTVAELAVVGLPGVIVPLPVGNGEQRMNAAPLEHAGGAIVVADEDITGATISGMVRSLLHDQEALASMSAGLRTIVTTNATADLLAMIERAACRGSDA